MIETNNPLKIKFGTKAETLERLAPHLRSAVVDRLIKFTVHEWQNDRDNIVDTIKSSFPNSNIIIRSSALNEDCLAQSNAGHYRSIGNVSPQNIETVVEAVESVISSYTDKNKEHQVFVQEFLNKVEMSGVIFTRDLNTLAPYITINYDDETGLTDTVTSGCGQNTKTIVIFKKKCFNFVDKRVDIIFEAVNELEQLFNNDALDIEFVYQKNVLHILQVRPIVKKDIRELPPDTELVKETLLHIYHRILELNSPHPDLYGKHTLFGIMPDWNPAEMIGIKPRPLALSLYRELITDNVWAYQRDNYGYKKLRSFPLLVSFAGHPYIDVRVDFNSWIPKSLNDDLSHKLSDYYLEKLKDSPASHDKIEFDIVFTCYTFDLEKKLAVLLDKGFSGAEVFQIKDSLLKITKSIIGYSDKEGLYKEDLKKIDILEERRAELLASSLSEVNKIYWLVEDCKRYGTLPFAGIARAGFVAVLFLNSLVELQIITLKEKNLFLNSLNTVAKQLSRDIILLKSGQITSDVFIKKYGHLRPGTYDILLDTYAENFNKYFELNSGSIVTSSGEEKIESFKLTGEQIQRIQKLLDEHDFEITVDQFFTFLKDAIEGREYGKFSFTKSVSELLTMIKKYGKTLGLKIEDMSFVDVGTIMKLYSTVAYFDEKELLEKEVERNKKSFNFYKFLNLPYLISKSEDIFCFSLSNIEPNYITANTVEAEIVKISSTINKNDIFGKIVFIENADPGFDWIFSHKIKGLVTMYGGVNSHMSIRAAELDIPAVIGCGPVLFKEWADAKLLKIDCSSKRVIVLSNL